METDPLLFGGIAIQQTILPVVISVVAAVTLLSLSALVAASEIALFSLNRQELDQMEEHGSKTNRAILHLLKSPQRLLATVLITRNLLNVAVVVLLLFATARLTGSAAVPAFGFILLVVIIILLLIVAEIMPKVYASRFVKETAAGVAPFLLVFEKLFGPLVSFLVNFTPVVNSALSRRNRSGISMDELSHALEFTSYNNEEDAGMLEGIVKFGNIRVVDIMTSRVDMMMIDVKTSYRQLLDKIIDSGYSRIPVYSGTRDTVKGVLYSKDLLPHLDKPDTFRWQSLIRQAYYVPETKMIDDLLLEFQENRVHLALVVDEYGGISGLITLDDILEEIVGDISDEYDEEEVLYTKIDNHTFVFEAKILLNDFFKIAEIEEKDFVKVTGEVETLAGLILELKGDIPSRNERIDYGRYVFEILAVDNRRIKKVKLYIKDDFSKSERV